ncbi:hypothetical protein FGO68_gene9824 [Halteria grandinella]|uniref:Uncharacterized protein n=1 Tax=Halteria grandinella TaxID=5974 RepID=A0A8J8T139_HALGN|nr:hypothetical protein FGO68_gene9824 [Halteria grandinella]
MSSHRNCKTLQEWHIKPRQANISLLLDREGYGHSRVYNVKELQCQNLLLIINFIHSFIVCLLPLIVYKHKLDRFLYELMTSHDLFVGPKLGSAHVLRRCPV